MCSVKWLRLVVMLAACWAQEGEWSEDAEDLGEFRKSNPALSRTLVSFCCFILLWDWAGVVNAGRYNQVKWKSTGEAYDGDFIIFFCIKWGKSFKHFL